MAEQYKIVCPHCGYADGVHSGMCTRDKETYKAPSFKDGQGKELTRRDFLKSGLTFLLGGAILSGDRPETRSTATVTDSGPAEKISEQLLPPEPTEPVQEEQIAAKEIEKMEPLQGVKKMLLEYNTWLNNLDADTIPDVDAIAKFVDIYNTYVKHIICDTALTPISMAKFHETGKADDFYHEIQPLVTLLETEGIYLRVAPMAGGWKGESMPFMAVFMGEIKTMKENTIARRGKTVTYQHIVVGLPDKEESFDDFCSAPTLITALTYEENEKVIILQNASAYTESAQAIYGNLFEVAQTEKEMAVQSAYGKYKDGDRSRNTATITDVLMSNSLLHEEQHALDGNLDEMGGNDGNAMEKWVITELRGLFAPMVGPNPRAAIENIYNWSIMQDRMRQIVGQTNLKVLLEISGKNSALELFLENDDALRVLGDKAMQVSEIYYEYVVVQKKSALDKGCEQEYKALMQKLKAN